LCCCSDGNFTKHIYPDKDSGYLSFSDSTNKTYKMAEQDPRAVFVTNISPNATEKTVSDFFSFCGRITRLTLRSSTEGSQEAIVVFESDSAAKTALLLTNALIVDRPITVVPYFPAADEETQGVTAEAGQATITERSHAVPDAERTKTSVMASLVAAGYVLGSDTIQRARDLDDKHMISLQLKVGAEQIKAKANEIDRTLHISETATAIKTGVVEKAKEVDEKLHITEKVGAAATAAKLQASALAAKANENETFAKGVGLLRAVGDAVTTSFQSFKEETSKAIDDKIQEKEGASPRAASPVVAASVPPPPVAEPALVPTPAEQQN